MMFRTSKLVEVSKRIRNSPNETLLPLLELIAQQYQLNGGGEWIAKMLVLTQAIITDESLDKLYTYLQRTPKVDTNETNDINDTNDTDDTMDELKDTKLDDHEIDEIIAEINAKNDASDFNILSTVLIGKTNVNTSIKFGM